MSPAAKAGFRFDEQAHREQRSWVTEPVTTYQNLKSRCTLLERELIGFVGELFTPTELGALGLWILRKSLLAIKPRSVVDWDNSDFDSRRRDGKPFFDVNRYEESNAWAHVQHYILNHYFESNDVIASLGSLTHLVEKYAALKANDGRPIFLTSKGAQNNSVWGAVARILDTRGGAHFGALRDRVATEYLKIERFEDRAELAKETLSYAARFSEIIVDKAPGNYWVQSLVDPDSIPWFDPDPGYYDEEAAKIINADIEKAFFDFEAAVDIRELLFSFLESIGKTGSTARSLVENYSLEELWLLEERPPFAQRWLIAIAHAVWGDVVEPLSKRRGIEVRSNLGYARVPKIADGLSWSFGGEAVTGIEIDGSQYGVAPAMAAEITAGRAFLPASWDLIPFQNKNYYR